MTMRVRTGFILMLAVAMMGLASCDHYNCGSGANFGSSTCTAGTPGIGGGGTTGNATAAFVFAVDTSSQTIDGYTLDTTANTLQTTSGYTAPTIPGDLGAGMVVAQNQFLYAAFRTTDQIYGWSISSAGGLTPISGSPYAAPFLTSINAGFVAQQNMIVNPAGTLLFLSDPVADEIFVYQIGTGGALTAVSGSPFPVPFGPLNLATDGLGKYLYAINDNYGNHTGSEIAAFAIGSGGSLGALTPVSGSPFTGPSYQMWQLAGEPTGQYLVGISGSSASIGGVDDYHLYVFSITQSGAPAGAITPVSGSPFPTLSSPMEIAVQSDTNGNLVYIFGVNDTDSGFNPIEGYQIGSGGTLTAVSRSPFSNVAEGSWGQFDPSGSFLFVYSTVDSDNTAVTQLGVNLVGSGGVLTDPVSPITLTTGGYWAVSDPQ